MNLWKDFRNDVRKRLETSNEKVKRLAREQAQREQERRESVGSREAGFSLSLKPTATKGGSSFVKPND